MATTTRERKPSTSAPISELKGPVGPEFSRPKHKRTVTGFGAGDINKVEASIPEPQREAWVPFGSSIISTSPADSSIYRWRKYVSYAETAVPKALLSAQHSLPKDSQARKILRFTTRQSCGSTFWTHWSLRKRQFAISRQLLLAHSSIAMSCMYRQL